MDRSRGDGVLGLQPPPPYGQSHNIKINAVQPDNMFTGSHGDVLIYMYTATRLVVVVVSSKQLSYKTTIQTGCVVMLLLECPSRVIKMGVVLFK